MKTKRTLRARIVAVLVFCAGVLLVSGSGLLCLYTKLGDAGGYRGSLSRLSFDIPFFFRGYSDMDIRLVYMDENAARALGQTSGIWQRSLHAKLVRRLASEGARAIFFDIVFSDPSNDPAEDVDFAAAMRESGNVFLGATLELLFTETGQLESERILPPVKVLRQAAAGWGLLAFRPLDKDYGVRYLYTGTERRACSTWEMARKLGASLPEDAAARAVPRWMNYYGPVGCFYHKGYDNAIDPKGVPPGYFKNKIVFVGGHPAIGGMRLGKDEFFHPNTRATKVFAPGIEIHATAFLNLFRHEWLVQLEKRSEDAIILGFGLLLVIILPRFSPLSATGLALVAAASATAFGGWLTLEKRIWFMWAIPALVQTPLALGWAVSTRYFLEERRRSQLRKAFGLYLSEEMADRIADADFDLTPGGKIVEATIIFTDLEGFTALSENLGDPKKISDVLIAYFTNTTKHVLGNNGTLIKYIGDAVLAVWGAPLPDPDQAYKATLAAWRMHEASGEEVLGHKLVTRVGVNTGEVLAGNLGSAKRIDYTVIGDAVNFASRLESLNKYFGTRILISEATVLQLKGRFITRRLGLFKVVGKDKATAIHELLGPAPSPEPMPWLESFAAGLEAFTKGSLEEAEEHMRSTLEQRGAHDGPATFYLKKIAELRVEGLPEGWSGVVEFTSK